MSTTTALQLLPLIEPAQAQKHVTHNEALAVLDVLVQTSATSRTLSAPPAAVVAGACYIVGDNATGDWQGEEGHVAVYSGLYWDFYVPKTGWRVWVESEGTEAVFDGAVWATSADRVERVAALGISADADDTNRLSVSAPATLLTHAGAGHQVKVNKARTSDTASVLFQSGYSGRAEMGIVGSDDFVLKVSPDGTTFLTGLTIEAATGRVVASCGINVVQGAGDPVSPQNGDIWYNATTHRLRAQQGGQTVDLVAATGGGTGGTGASAFGQSLIDDADASAARITLERQDFATRAAFVTWAAGRGVSVGLVMRAANAAYRYTGTGTAIADLAGWVPNGTATALHWGADTTGGTNAIPAVSAMIDYVNAQGGGVAYLPAGTYLWTGEMLKSGLNNVVLEGEGNATKLLRRTNRPAAAIKFFLGANNRIRNLKLDCAGYSGIGIFLSDQYSGAENVEIVNSPDRAFALRGGGNASWGIDGQGRTSDDAGFSGAVFFPVGCYLENCRATKVGSTAFSQKQMPHSRIQRCVARTVYSEGVTIDKCDYSVVSANTLLDCALTSGNQWPDLDAGAGYLAVGGGGVGAVGIDGSTGARFVNNTLIGVNTNIASRNNRIRVAVNFMNNIQAANGCEVEGNYISDAKAGVWLKGTVSGAAGNTYRCIVKGNVFDAIGTGAGTGMAQYGAIWIDSGCTDNVISENTQIGGTPLITGAGGANTLDQMAAATIRGNATNGLAVGQDLTGGQATALLDTFSSTAKGLAPASGGGTSTFLRADGTWAPASASGAEWGGITGKPTTLTGYGITDAQSAAQKGAASGYAALDASGKVPSAQLPSVGFADLTGKPTTLTGYGITDAQSAAQKGVASGYAALDASGKVPSAQIPSVAFADLTSKPTTLTGYGITDAQSAAQKGAASGYAALDASGKVPSAQLPSVGFADLTSKPTTLSGYGITDAQDSASKGVASGYASLDASGKVPSAQMPSVGFSDLTGKPTTLSGYGITDALGLANAQTVTGAKTFSVPIILSGVTADPANLTNGSIWFNTTAAQLRARIGDVTKVIQTGQEIPWLTPIAGEYMMTTVCSAGTTATLTPAANQLRIFPFAPRVDTPIKAMALNVVTGVAAAVSKFVVYDSDTNGRPNTMINETADVDCSTTGNKFATLSLTLRRGQTYWLGTRHNSAASVTAWVGSATPDINGGTPVTTARKSLLRTVAYATAAPPTWVWAAGEINATSPAAIWLMV